MTTLAKVIISTVLGLLMMSCNFDMNFGVNGNGNVTTTERSLDGSFSAIKVSRGLDVYITQTNTESVSVEADENLQDIIMVEIEGDVLNIYAEENIGTSKSKKIMVSLDDLTKISTTSGSDVFSTNTINTNTIEIKTTSGSDLELDINAENIDCSSTSGSHVKLSGKTNKLYASATSGSDISAQDLSAVSCQVKATSGANITVNTSEELIAKASSGGDINYYGNPKKVETSDNVSGSIRKR